VSGQIKLRATGGGAWVTGKSGGLGGRGEVLGSITNVSFSRFSKGYRAKEWKKHATQS